MLDSLLGAIRLARSRASRAQTPAVMLSLTICLFACATPMPTGPYDLLPLGPDGVAAESALPVRWEEDGVLVELEPLDEDLRSELLERSATPEASYVHLPAGTELISFRLRLTATSNKPVRIETQSLRLIPDDGGGGTAPIDYTRAYELFRPDQHGEARARELKRFMRGVLDGPVSVSPGHVEEGLLVFPSPSAEARRLFLDLPFLQVGAETFRTRLGFAKVFESEVESISTGG